MGSCKPNPDPINLMFAFCTFRSTHWFMFHDAFSSVYQFISQGNQLCFTTIKKVGSGSQSLISAKETSCSLSQFKVARWLISILKNKQRNQLVLVTFQMLSLVRQSTPILKNKQGNQLIPITVQMVKVSY